MGELLLGIDVGTSSSKGVLVNAAGDVLKSHVVRHAIEIPRPGWAEQDADAVWWADIVAICKDLLDGAPYTGGDVAGVGLSALGPCMLPLDREGRPLRKAILYGIDTRAAAEIDWLNKRYGEEVIFEAAGMALTSQSVAPKILWMRRNEPDLWSRLDHVTTASAYLTYRMTGEKVIDRRTASYFSPMLDIRSLEWSGRLADEIIDLDKLPRLGWSDEVAGLVHAEAAAATGLNPGTPVAVGCIDSLSEALSAGAIEPGDMALIYGSTTVFNLVLDQPKPNRKTWLTAGAFAGQYTLIAGMGTTGAVAGWFRDELARDLTGEDAVAELFAEAERIEPGAGGLLLLPYFSGERTPIHDPHARGVIAGLTLAHTRGHLFRAVLEGVAYGIRHNLEVIRPIAPVERVIAVGGGTRSRAWVQIVSDVAKIAQVLPAKTVGASYGGAFLAGLASGILTRDALASWVTYETEITPNPEHSERYEHFYRDYLKLYQQTRDIVHDLSRLS